ncbi:MAG: squalene/phytoene synthase family protein [Terrimicrobiaceae bacterium]
MLALLKRVSRSFYLSLRLLPHSVRPTLSLAYLLARASDSIADASTVPVELRSQWLGQLRESLSQSSEGRGFGGFRGDACGESRGHGRPARVVRNIPGGDGLSLNGRDARSPWDLSLLGTLPDGEKDLLEFFPALLQNLDASPDKAEILSVWKIILSGQIFDLERFAAAPSPLTLDEAVHYTGLVAGCVGRFWTEVCFKHIPRYSDEPPEELAELGFAFGCGLQWVNILRDRHADAVQGRIYVTEQNFLPALAIARKNLDAGARYAALVRPRRLRAACLLPWELGFRTLELVAANPQSPRVKVSRAFVWRSLVRALWH